MYDAPKVIFGIIVFVALFTSPIWLNLFSGQEHKKPELKYPEYYKECIYSKEYMNHNHMEILNDWRDRVVRKNERFLMSNGKFVMLEGKRMELSLSLTCMECHSTKANFCDKCHDYLAVKPYCWDCHVAPKEVKP